MSLRCLEGSTMSNLVHRQRRCARIVLYTILCLKGSTPEDREGLFLFIALARMGTFCKEGDGRLSVWVLRARSY